MIERLAMRTGGFVGSTAQRTFRAVEELLPGVSPPPRRRRGRLASGSLPMLAGTALAVVAGLVSKEGLGTKATKAGQKSSAQTSTAKKAAAKKTAAKKAAAKKTAAKKTTAKKTTAKKTAAKKTSAQRSPARKAASRSSTGSRSSASNGSAGRNGSSRRPASSRGNGSSRSSGSRGTGNSSRRNQAGGSGKASELKEKSRQDLYEMAQDAGIDGRSAMSKDELTRVLSKG